MYRIRSQNLIIRVGISVVVIELILMSLVGVIYFNRFAANVDERQVERLRIAAEMIRQSQMNLTTLTDRETMSLLLGEEIKDAMLITEKGIVAFSLNPEYRKRSASDIPFLDQKDLRSANSDLSVSRTKIGGEPYLVSMISLPVYDLPSLTLYFRVGVASAEREKSNVIILLLAGFFVTAVATSAVLMFVLNRIVLKPVRKLAQAAQKVQAGDLTVRADFNAAYRWADDERTAASQTIADDLKARVAWNPDDEIGALAHALNAMTGQLKDSIISLEQRLAELDRTSHALKESEERYRLVFENSPVSIWEEDFSDVKKRLDGLRREGVTDLDAYFDQRPETIRECAAVLGITDINQAAVTLLAAQRKEELLEDLTKVLTPEALDTFRRQLVCLWNGQTELVEETVVKTLSGAHRHVTLYFSVCPGYETTLSKVLVSLADISERKQAEEDVRRINQELENRVAMRTSELLTANKELEAFSYSVSHDLRAPLRHIDGYLALLKESAWQNLDEESRRHVDTMAKSIRRMGTLIEDLLSFSRMGRQTMSATPVDLGVMVADVIAEMEPETRGRDIHWNISELPVVTGDQAMLRVVLVNLISNALKFTQKRERAEITIGCLPDQAAETVVFVRDNGAGFDMRYHDKLFGVFQRLHRMEEFQGTGIGLANVFRIVARHGGRAWAEGAVDLGATFYFSLPTENA